MAREGWPFIMSGLIVAAIGAALGASVHPGWYALAAVAGILTVFVAYFFRDPDRVAPDSDGAIVSVADGRIVSVIRRPDGRTQIDTFLSVFNVHVNRSPAAGRVVATEYRPGRFFPAMKPEAGRLNERQDIVLQTSAGELQFAQIAGVLARRIVCRVRAGDELKTGERVGMIRFGSRAEVVLPAGFDAAVALGDKVRAGETIIGQRVSAGRHADEQDVAAGLAVS